MITKTAVRARSKTEARGDASQPHGRFCITCGSFCLQHYETTTSCYLNSLGLPCVIRAHWGSEVCSFLWGWRKCSRTRQRESHMLELYRMSLTRRFEVAKFNVNFASVNVYVHTCMFIHNHVCVYMLAHAHRQTHTRTHMHTNMHHSEVLRVFSGSPPQELRHRPWSTQTAG